MVGKKPNEMKGPEDFYRILELVPGEQVLPPLSETGCHLPPYKLRLSGRCCRSGRSRNIAGPSFQLGANSARRCRQAELLSTGLDLMPTLPQFLSQAFNGIALGSLLALIACGLTIILGTLGVLNFAHGAMFMLGAYTAFIVLGHWDSFAAALARGRSRCCFSVWRSSAG